MQMFRPDVANSFSTKAAARTIQPNQNIARNLPSQTHWQPPSKGMVLCSEQTSCLSSKPDPWTICWIYPILGFPVVSAVESSPPGAVRCEAASSWRGSGMSCWLVTKGGKVCASSPIFTSPVFLLYQRNTFRGHKPCDPCLVVNS